MNTRREDILKTALRLFNERGIDGVTTRDIAKAVKISLGNLTYYFPSKKDIVLALTQQLCVVVDETLTQKPGKPAKNVLVHYFNQVETIFTAHFKFNFIVHKRYGEIISSFPDIQKFIQDFLKVRFDSWVALNKQLVKEKLARQDLVKESHAHSHVLNILALYWHQEFLIYFPELTDRQKVDKALAIFFQAYKPYLTKKGLDVLNPLLEKLGHY